MPVSIVRRYAVPAFVVATVLAIVVVVVPFVGTAATTISAAPDLLMRGSPVMRQESTRIDLVAGGSEARYRAQEVLSGRGFNEAVGRASSVTGAIMLDASGAVLPDQSRISVDLTTLQSDSPMRDRYIQRTTLQTEQFPSADFVVTAAPGLPIPLPTSGSATFELVGDLTVHGITRSATWQTTATFAEREVSGTASTTVLITDFGMEPPRAGPVLSIEDAVRLELDVRATVAPSIADLLVDPS
jgi:polyisoprenoid-binding protein YceI